MPAKVMFETALTDTWTATAGADIGDKPGDIRWERTSAGMKCYKCVIFDNGTDNIAAVAGKAAYYLDATGYATHTVTMDFSSAAGAELGAGIFQSVPADGSRCWVQIKGIAVGVSGLLNAAADDDLRITAADAAADGELTVVNLDTETPVGTVLDEAAFTIVCDFPF
jgi:propanediol dehydratase large subunit